MNQPFQAAESLRSSLRDDLVTAMKARETDIVGALRSAIAAIDNAEAVAAPASTKVEASETIAGATAGVGSTEFERRDLSITEVQMLLSDQMAECEAAAELYESHGQQDAASRLRREADALRKYLA